MLVMTNIYAEITLAQSVETLAVNPLNPQDQNLKSHLLPLFISYGSSGEKLIKYQANSSCVIMSVSP